MSWRNARRFLPALLVTLSTGLPYLLATPVLAGETGVLMLHVLRCSTMSPITGAAVDVVLYRPGVGQIDADAGSTNGQGRVDFTFEDLEPGDQAQVTVTPSGENPDGDHTYYWVVPDDRAAGTWDVSDFEDDQCADARADKDGTIQCFYQ